MSKESRILAEFKKVFPKCVVKRGSEIDKDAVICCSGESKVVQLIDGDKYVLDAMNVDATSSNYRDGIHVKLYNWAERRGMYWEIHDIDTMLCYKI